MFEILKTNFKDCKLGQMLLLNFDRFLKFDKKFGPALENIIAPRDQWYDFQLIYIQIRNYLFEELLAMVMFSIHTEYDIKER